MYEPSALSVRLPYSPASAVLGANTGVSWASGSVGAGRIPDVVSLTSSLTLSAAAATEGASLVPLMVTVRVLDAVPPCPSLTV